MTFECIVFYFNCTLPLIQEKLWFGHTIHMRMKKACSKRFLVVANKRTRNFYETQPTSVWKLFGALAPTQRSKMIMLPYENFYFCWPQEIHPGWQCDFSIFTGHRFACDARPILDASSIRVISVYCILLYGLFSNAIFIKHTQFCVRRNCDFNKIEPLC